MLDATDVKAHPTASSLNKGGCTPRLIGGTKGGMTNKLHGVCHSKGGPLRLHLREGQCSGFTGADVLLKGPAACCQGGWGKGMNRDKSRKMLPAGHHALHPGLSLPQEASPRPEEAGSQVSQNRDALFPIEGLAAGCNPLRRLRPHLPFCHPPGRHRPLLVMSPDPGVPSRRYIYRAVGSWPGWIQRWRPMQRD